MDPVFWMGGIAAGEVVEVRRDLAALREPGFWVILGTFEGDWTFLRCNQVARSRPWKFPSQIGEVGEWHSSIDRAGYIDYVHRIKDAIAAGEVYQVNACRILQANVGADFDIRALMSKIVDQNPAPYACYLSMPSIEIASASPERFISLADRVITSSPIKGTSKSVEFPDKDRAENLMIVDLMRNDIGRIAKTGSISTPRLLDIEQHPGLFHLVSDISGELKDGVGIDQVLQALMPPGSVSGAPKSRALRIIEANEGIRGPYCGALGWYSDGAAEIAVGIRTFWREDGALNFGTGAGITWESDPEAEWEETELKARKLLSLVVK